MSKEKVKYDVPSEAELMAGGMSALEARLIATSARKFFTERDVLMDGVYNRDAAMYAGNPSLPRIDPKSMLLDETCLMAVTSVTEAIYRASLGKTKLSILDTATLAMAQFTVAQQQTASDATKIGRPGEEFFFPWTDSQRGDNFGKGQPSAKKMGDIALGLQHHFLLHVRHDPNRNVAAISRLDSKPGYIKDQIRLQMNFENVIKQLQWCPHTTSFWHEDVLVADQEKTTCGIHTILNAWTRALGLGYPWTPSDFMVDPYLRFRDLFYTDAATIINLALGGQLSSAEIFRFLIMYRWLDEQYCPSPSTARSFDHTVAVPSTDTLTELKWKAGHLMEHLVSRGYKLSKTTETSAQIELLDCLDSAGVVQPGHGNWRKSTQNFVAANAAEAREESMGVLLSMGYVVGEDLDPSMLADWYALHQRGKISPPEQEN